MGSCYITQGPQPGALWWPKRVGWEMGEGLRRGIYEGESEVAQSCPTLCDRMDCSPPGSSVCEIFQSIRILKWVASSFSRGSFWPRNQTGVSCIAGRFFTSWATREAPPKLVVNHIIIFLNSVGNNLIIKYSISQLIGIGWLLFSFNSFVFYKFSI